MTMRDRTPAEFQNVWCMCSVSTHVVNMGQLPHFARHTSTAPHESLQPVCLSYIPLFTVFPTRHGM